MRRLIFALVLLPIVFCLPVRAQERTDPIDVIVALDKSLSMVGKFEAVQEYVTDYLIDQVLIPGDLFLVVAFYGQTEVPVSMTIGGEADKAMARRIIGEQIADGRFTDIGNALDVLTEKVEKYSDPERRKLLLLVTDGIQEAPPDSRYYSPDGSFNHAFLQSAEVIQKKGWRVHILGIGLDTQARELAEELGGTHLSVSEEPSKEELIESTRRLLAVLEAHPEVRLGPLDPRGRGRLELTVSSQGHEDTKRVRIRSILLSLPGEAPRNILPGPVTWEIPPGSSARYQAPVLVPALPAAGEHSGRLEFEFAGPEGFVPVVMPVRFRVLSFFGSYRLWILIAIAAIVLAAVLIGLFAIRSRKARFRFHLVVEGQTSEQSQVIYRIVEGRPQYLDEQEGVLAVGPNRSPQSLARLTAIRQGVRMALLRPEKFPRLTEVPVSVLDFDFRVRVDLERKRDLTVRLARVG